MAATLLQTNHANVSAGATSLACVIGIGSGGTTPQALTQGSLIVVYAGTVAAGRTFTASDPTNGAYNVDVSPGQSQAILSFPNNQSTANSLTVTVVMSGATSSIEMIVEEWSGVEKGNPFDQKASTTGASATTGNTGTTPTLQQIDELALAMIHLNGGSANIAPTTAGFSASPSSPWPSGSTGLIGAASAQPLSSAGQICTFTWTTAQPWKACIATYRNITANDVTVNLSGQTNTFTEGIITATGGDVPGASTAGGTGSSARRRKIKRASEVFHEEMAALERRLTEARDTRESIETTLAEVSAGKGDVLHGELRQLTHGERALRAAQMAEAPDPAAIPVYIRIPKKSVGVKRVEAIERLRTLSRIARYREELASEKLRKVREKIDEDAAVSFMQAMMREWN